ncbi:N-acetylmuramate alpha-1-phosphate uridylyltransferase MurU [Halioxenophilus sp. WMMB6]|uniref:N-acetylmuramate alpha-1-phosphate uridylyltransferase MurU n=1 Tax=Halioxenophilus sp. WMMB6 TaxID=3073815 RepID=UPI00295E3F85|nr:nucleotidyltransferase family protein [Halioxenophilus sp. WMMB6]
MLLAAGKGTRMLPLTATTPKPLLQVADDTLIGHHLRRLRAAGIEQVVINTAYLGQQIVDAIGDGSDYGLVVTFSREAEPLETAGGINRALALLGAEPFLLVNGDVWCDLPLAELAALTLPSETLGHLILVANPEHNPSGDFSCAANRVGQRLVGAPAYTYSGIALLRPELVADYPERRDCFGLKEVFDWAIAQSRLSGQVYDGYWLDVGTPERLATLRRRLAG